MPRVNSEMPTLANSAPLRVRVAPLRSDLEKRQAKALKDLMKKREQEAKRTGIWNNYNTN